VSEGQGRRGDGRGEETNPGQDAPKPRLLLHAGLFLATFLTTTATGALHAHHGAGIAPIGDGLSYSLPLILILLCHELGHYIVARRHGVAVSLPYFIPLLPGLGLGTLGAAIGMRDATTDRKRLIDVGAAGPLAGLAVAIPFMIYGLSQSEVGPRIGVAAPGSLVTMEGNSILYLLMKWIIKGAWLPNSQSDVFLHPTAYAAWAGLLITMINLLPIGQLDGGHIASAYFGNRYNRVAEVLRRSLPVVAIVVFFWVLYVVKGEAGAAWNLRAASLVAMAAAFFWVLWYLLVAVMRRMTGGVNHPPVDDKPLPRSRRALFWLMVVVFVAVFMPVPLRQVMVGAPGSPPPTESLGG
jgi:membrane-associated protease RseP (regulator of RpoE activity)